MRRLVALLPVPLLAVAVTMAPPASAAVEVLGAPTASLSAPYAGASTDAVIKTRLTQTSYADISLDISLSGFRAERTFAYGKGACPSSVARVTLPAKVTVAECGWTQEGEDAVLRLALKGTMTKGNVKVRIMSGALTAPAVSGTYGIFLSSWAFDEAMTTTDISSGPLK
ncbi:MAG: hypothetical protein B7C55_07480 [Actinomycetales bacterium mxb001]|nr:MAG: hypothetical protein B7C55_07480 [Actinomycetales bacterium mxb001]